MVETIEKFDAIVVGAGPAGSSAARMLAEAGKSVMIYDRREELGVPVRCGEALEHAAEDFIGKVPKRAICRDIQGARVYAPNGKYVTASDDVGGYILDRKVFDKWLATEAIKEGAKVQADTLITDLVKDGNKTIGVKGHFMGNPFEARSDVVICATGAESRLGAQSGLKTFCSMQLVDVCVEYEMAGITIPDQEDWEDYIHLWIGKEVAPRGYYWVFPKGDTVANVGIGVIPSAKYSALKYHEKWLAEHPEIAGNASILEVKGGMVPVGGFMKSMVTDGFMIAGEAGHHVNPIHGGGIKEAIIAGQIAGKVAAEGLTKGDISKESLSAFNTRWWEDRGNRLAKVEKLREVMEKMSDDDFNMLIDAIDPQDLVRFGRGEKHGALAKLLMRRPKLIMLARHLL